MLHKGSITSIPLLAHITALRLMHKNKRYKLGHAQNI